MSLFGLSGFWLFVALFAGFFVVTMLVIIACLVYFSQRMIPDDPHGDPT